MGGIIGIGGSSQRSTSSSRQFVDPAQQPFLDFVRNAGIGVFGQQQQGLQGQFGQAQQFQQQGQGFLGQLGQAPQVGQFANQSFAPQQIQGVQNVLNRNLTENLLPAITAGAVGSGTAGGSRQGVAQGLAVRGTQEALRDVSGSIFAQDLQRQQQAAQAADLTRLGGAQAGLQGLSGLQNIGLAPFAAQLAPLLALAAAIGTPTVVSESQTRGRRTGFELGFGEEGFLPGIFGR